MIKYSTIWFYGSSIISLAVVMGLIMVLASGKFSWTAAGVATVSLLVAGLLLLYGNSAKRFEEQEAKKHEE